MASSNVSFTPTSEVSNSDNLDENSNKMPIQEPLRRQSTCPTVQFMNIFPVEKEDLLKSKDSGPKVSTHVSTETIASGRHLKMVRMNYVDSKGNNKSCEGVHMTGHQEDLENNNTKFKMPSSKGELCTIAVLRKQIMCDSLILTKQYRAPLKAYTIEFPARVIDHTSPQDLAAQEVEDDTGYSNSVIQYISPFTSLEPDISDGKLQFVSLTIDGDDPMAQPRCSNNNQSQDDNNGAHGDIVEVLKIPINSLIDRLEKYNQMGYVIDSRVYAFSIGLQRGANLLRAEQVLESESPM